MKDYIKLHWGISYLWQYAPRENLASRILESGTSTSTTTGTPTIRCCFPLTSLLDRVKATIYLVVSRTYNRVGWCHSWKRSNESSMWLPEEYFKKTLGTSSIENPRDTNIKMRDLLWCRDLSLNTKIKLVRCCVFRCYYISECWPKLTKMWTYRELLRISRKV